jgi:hypothetical protein
MLERILFVDVNGREGPQNPFQSGVRYSKLIPLVQLAEGSC